MNGSTVEVECFLKFESLHILDVEVDIPAFSHYMSA